KTSSCRKSARTLWGPAGRGESPCAAGRPYLLVALVSRRLRRSNSLLVQVEAHLLASEENAGHRLCAVAFRLGGVAGASGSSLGGFHGGGNGGYSVGATANAHLYGRAGALPGQFVLARSERGAVDLDAFIDIDAGLFTGKCRRCKKQGSAEEKTLAEVLGVHRISL